jgi:hypothetical protein
MTIPDALLAAALASPDDHSLRLVWLDAFQEQHGETPWVQATREFLCVCGERRKYEKCHHTGDPVTEGKSWDHRRALPGWREWLAAPGEQTYRVDGKPLAADVFPSFAIFHEERVADSMNWHRLVPSLWEMLKPQDKWRRSRNAVTILQQLQYSSQRIGTVRMEFNLGFVRQVEFPYPHFADDLLPGILEDQPFCEPRIRDSIAYAPTSGSVRSGSTGPAFQILEGFDAEFSNHSGEQFRLYRDKIGMKGSERARRALSDALRKRALGAIPNHLTTPLQTGPEETPRVQNR